MDSNDRVHHRLREGDLATAIALLERDVAPARAIVDTAAAIAGVVPALVAPVHAQRFTGETDRHTTRSAADGTGTTIGLTHAAPVDPVDVAIGTRGGRRVARISAVLQHLWPGGPFGLLVEREVWRVGRHRGKDRTQSVGQLVGALATAGVAGLPRGGLAVGIDRTDQGAAGESRVFLRIQHIGVVLVFADFLTKTKRTDRYALAL